MLRCGMPLLLLCTVLTAGNSLSVTRQKNPGPLATLLNSIWDDIDEFYHEISDIPEEDVSMKMQAGCGPMKCSAGTYCNTTAKKCDDCPAGTFSGKNAPQCTPCAAGHYNPRPAQGQCQECGAGTFANTTGSISCTVCAPGYINRATGSTGCTACSPGSYSDTEHTHCMVCGTGTYSDKPTDKCSSCSPGTFTPYSGSVTCALCRPGTFAATTGSSSCEGCPAGRFSDKAGTVICGKCDKGSYSLGNATLCNLCEPGTYSSKTGSTSCVPCEPGYSTNDARGATACAACSPGTFSDRVRSKNCTECLSGSYQRKYGQTHCILCGRGSYQGAAGSASCISCPNNRTYTTYAVGSKLASDCQGPLLTYADTRLHELTDAGNVTFSGILTVRAVKGDWLVRNSEHPFTEHETVKQGKTVELKGAALTLTLEPIMANMFCYKDPEGHGLYFAGYQNADISGAPCQNGTYCRNDDSQTAGPHCHVASGSELVDSTCGIPQCLWDVECAAGDGTGYRGNAASVQVEGTRYDCQAWNKNHPHISFFHPSEYNTVMFGIGPNNLCRNPDPERSRTPWCYTTNVWVRSAVCNVPRCDQSYDYFRK